MKKAVPVAVWHTAKRRTHQRGHATGDIIFLANTARSELMTDSGHQVITGDDVVNHQSR